MSLKYGLNLKKAAPTPVRRAAFDEEDDDDERDSSTLNAQSPKQTSGSNHSRPKSKLSGPPPPTPLRRLQKLENEAQPDISTRTISEARIQEAQELDSAIFDYDSFHDAKTTVDQARKEAVRKDALERKPKYINNLLDAAARRKQDQLVAREKLLQRERAAEGDEFADKETFVTDAYKKQQEESRRVQEEEERRIAEDARRKRQMGGGMQSFYRDMMDQSEKQHQATVEAAARLEKEGTGRTFVEEQLKSDAQLVEELKAKGIKIQTNEEGEITDKRQLLSAGLNVGAPGRVGASRNADHLKSSNRSSQSAFPARDFGSQQASRERQTRMMEEQLAAQAKRAREEEDVERARLEKAAKSTKTERDVSDAKARYLARKAARERGDS